MSQENEHELKSLKKLQVIEGKHKKFLRWANFFMFTAIGIGLFLFFHYLYNYGFEYDAKSGLADLGTFLSGTVGILITIASVFYLVYNLRIQNESLRLSIQEVELTVDELKTSNLNFLKQKQENLFFNLLDHHTKLVNNFNIDSLKQLYGNTKNNLMSYKESLVNKEFGWIGTTHNNPQHIYANHQEIKPIIENIFHIIKYVEKTLDDRIFYLDTLYNTLSEGERFFVGMLLVNKIIAVENFEYKKYANFFENNSRYKNFENDGVFPVLEITHRVKTNGIYTGYFDNVGQIKEIFSYELKTLRTYLGLETFYRGYEMQLQYSSTNYQPISRFNRKDKLIPSLGGLDINYYTPEMESVIKEHILPQIQGKGMSLSFGMYVRLLFESEINTFSRQPTKIWVNHKLSLNVNDVKNDGIFQVWISGN